jgi:hypothetical protein
VFDVGVDLGMAAQNVNSLETDCPPC